MTTDPAEADEQHLHTHGLGGDPVRPPAGAAPVEILTVGETMAMVTPRLPQALSSASDFRVEAGGAESNVAGQLAALGRRVGWYSRLGADPLGERVLNQLRARAIDVDRVELDPTHPTGVYFKDPGQGVYYYRSNSAAAHLDAAAAWALDLQGVRLLHTTGITPALSASAAEFLEVLLKRARQEGILISFDVNYRPALWTPQEAAAVLRKIAHSADIVFVGLDEAQDLWGTADLPALRAHLDQVPELVVKDGAVGATVFEGERHTHVPANRVEVVEAVGAGDAFAGGYLDARLSHSPTTARLEQGHARAALTLRTTADMPEATGPTQEKQ